MKKLLVLSICFLLLSACVSGGGTRPSGSSASVFIDSIQFIGTNDYCCWTTQEYSFYTSNIKNSDGASGDPRYMRNSPDGQYAILNNGFGLITGTNASVQQGIKVYIASGSSGEYQVWGGTTIPAEVCSSKKPSHNCWEGVKKLAGNPLKYGFELLGQGNSTKEFPGEYLYYIIKQ